MYLYYTILFIILFLYLRIYSSNLKNKKSIYIILSFILLIVISSIRAKTVGGDLNHYIPNYISIGKQSWEQLFQTRYKYGYIYSILCKVAYSINTSEQSYLFFTSLCNLLPIAYFIKKHSPRPWLSIYIYITMGFYTNTFNSVRSSMALALGVFMLHYIIERKFWMFFIFYLAALEIHQTFLPFIILYPFYQKKLSLKYIIGSISLCFILAQILLRSNIISIIAYIYDPGAYSSSISDTFEKAGYSLFLLLSAMTITFYLINKNNITNEVQLFLHCMVIGSGIQAFAICAGVVTRIAMFFYIVMIVLFPTSLLTIKRLRLRRWGYCITLILFLAYFKIFIMTPDSITKTNSQGTIPYKTYWER